MKHTAPRNRTGANYKGTAQHRELHVCTHSVADIQLDLKLMNDHVHIMACTMSSFVLHALKKIRDPETGDEATLFII